MAKFAATAALVLGAVALAATGVGAIAGAAAYEAAGTLAAVSTATTAASIASAASIGATAAGLAGALLAKKPKNDSPTPTTWRADPQAGVPYSMGECFVAGNIIYRQAWGDGNKLQTIITVYSGAGPIQGFETFYVDNVAKTINADATVNIADFGYMYCSTQIGRTPEARQLGDLGPPGWTAQSKLSGYAASSITLKYDTKGKFTMTSTPQCGWVGKWVLAYDARKDSTYPGGSGPQRRDDESTWAWSENPGVHAHTWIIGRRQNGTLVLGAGMDAAGILDDNFVELANVCDANGWTIAGTVYSTDDKWEVLKQILQAGGAEPLRIGGQLGCLINTPRVSLATITTADLAGEVNIQATQSRKNRINAVVPGYMAEQSVTTEVNGQLQTSTQWVQTTAAPIIIAPYVTFDGRIRQREVRYSLVKQLNQAAQLARYEIENAREFGPITLGTKLRWIGYKPGDVITAQLPEDGLPGQDILILNRELDPGTIGVTLTARSETAAKHPFALGQTTIAPATPSVSGPPLLPVPGQSAWAITGESVSANGTTIPALVIQGAVDSDVVDAIVFEFRVYSDVLSVDAGWQTALLADPTTTGCTMTGVQDDTVYECAVSYRRGSATGDRLVLGPVAVGQTSLPWSTGISGSGKPEDNATVGATIGVDLRDAGGKIVFPADVLNPDIDLSPDGRLTSTDVDGVVTQIGQLDLPEIDVTVAAGQAQLVSDFAQLAATVIQLLAGQNNTTQIFRDAGLYIDPATGTARLSAIDAQADRLSQVQVVLDAVNAAISLKASQADLSDQGLRLTTAEQNISAATGTVSTSVASIRQNSDQAGETNILALLQGDAATRSLLTAYAAGKQDLTARLDGTDSAIAALTLRLVVQIGSLSAQVGTETSARIDGDTASAKSLASYQAANDQAVGLITANLGVVTQGLSTVTGYVTTLQGQVADPNTGLIKSVSNIQQTLSTQNDLNSAFAFSISNLNTQVQDPNNGLLKNMATVQTALTAQATTNSSFAGSITQLTTTTQNHSSTLTTYGQSIDGLENKWGVEIDNNGNITGISLNNQNNRTDFNIVADRFKYVDPNGGNAQTVFEYENGVLYMVAKLVAASIEAGMLDVNSAITPALWTLGSPVTGGGWDDGSGTTTGSDGGSSTGGSGSGGTGGKGGTAQP